VRPSLFAYQFVVAAEPDPSVPSAELAPAAEVTSA
jgi:hypothetical protein